MAFPSPTKTYHTTSYASISPALPALSSKGKNIAVTGAGTGIGKEIAKSFAKSGASHISLLGRTEKTLLETKKEIKDGFPETSVSVYVADLAKEQTLQQAFAKIHAVAGVVHVLIANAGWQPSITTILESDADELETGLLINVKGNSNLFKAFAPYAAPDAAIIHTSSAAAHATVPLHSSYSLGKLAATKLFEFIHLEHPNFFVLNVHPGTIETQMAARSLASGIQLPIDDISLPADFTVWAASPEARFLNGKFVWAHWDVDELKALEKDIRENDRFVLGLTGFP